MSADLSDFQRRLGISRKVLSERLNSLTRGAILARQKCQSTPDRYEDSLTDKGHLRPILAAIKAWEERWEQ